MDRLAMLELIRWKNKTDRKPLFIRGARQVGKTWLMKEFGLNEYNDLAYIDFETTRSLQTLFEQNLDTDRIFTAIQIQTGVTINNNTLLVFDEIQAAPSAISAIKYFYENVPDIHIIAASSLAGNVFDTKEDISYMECMDMHPMNFSEFLAGVGEQPLLDLIESRDWNLINTFREKYLKLLKDYCYVGGMPEAVIAYSYNHEPKKSREVHKKILALYKKDFNSSPGDISSRISTLWESVPTQLFKENKKFIYKVMKPGARAREYEPVISWLSACGLIYKINRVSNPEMPVSEHEDKDAFKVFPMDTGILCAMCNMDVKILNNGNRILSDFDGAITEQYVAQQLISNGFIDVYYWSSDTSRAEVDFLIHFDEKIVPVEVKAEENSKAKSLRVFCDRFNPQLSIRISTSDFRKDDWMVNLPLYAIN